MQLLRQLGAAIGMFVVFVLLVILGFASTQTGLVALALFCAWPLTFGVAAWTLRGLKDMYQLVPKEPRLKGGQRPTRAAPGVHPGESFN